MSDKHQLRRSSENYRYWSTEELDLLRKLAEDYSAKEIVPIMGRTLGSVKQALLSNGIKIKKRPRYPFSNADDVFIRSNLGKLTHAQIAEQLNKSKLAVTHRVRRLGLSHTYKPALRCLHSEEDVELCRQLHDAGLSVAAIADKMEIPFYTVRNIVTYRTHLNALPKHVFRFEDSA